VRAQVDRGLTTVSCFDRLLGLIKNLGRHSKGVGGASWAAFRERHEGRGVRLFSG
jgi:hypothetical protein